MRALTSLGLPSAARWPAGSVSLSSRVSCPASSSSPWARLTSRLVTPALALSTTTRVAGLASTTSAQWFMAAASATLVPPNLATLMRFIAYPLSQGENPVSSGKREEEAKMAGKREDPGQKHSTVVPIPHPILLDACGMHTTDDNRGFSPAADVAVSSHSPRLGAAP